MNLRDRFALVALACVHFAIQVVLIFLSFGGAMIRLETGAEPHWTDRLIDLCAYLLTFPVVWIGFVIKLPELGRPLWELFALNSLVWGGLGWWLITRWIPNWFFPRHRACGDAGLPTANPPTQSNPIR